MNRSSLAALCMVVAVPCLGLGQDTLFTKRWKNEAREGPGAYYPLKALLNEGTQIKVLKASGDWRQFSLEPVTGEPGAKAWIAKNCLGEKPPESSWMGAAQRMRDKLAAPSPSRVSASVRGFALRFGKAKESDLNALLKLQPPFFSPKEYQAFKTEPGGPRPGPSVSKLSALTGYDVKLTEEGVGLGIAARVAAKGLSDNRALLRYLNLLGTTLAEASGAYDYPFKFYVTTGKEINAVAVPGGYIFVSQALLSVCRDEAELAAVLAHEMTHIVKKHGLKETKARDVNIKADEAADELDQMAGDSPDAAAEADLNDFADAAYETINKPRTQSYELEADQGAVLILARAGYEPSAVPRMISRVAAALASAPSSKTDNPFSQIDYKDRQDKADAFLRQLGLPKGGESNSGRFERNAGSAR